jgi:hypothetical protein
MTKKEKILRAIWMYNKLIEWYPSIYRYLKKQYEVEHD